MKVGIQSNRKKDTFYVHWNIGKRCNYDCVYCADSLHDFKSPHRPLEEMLAFVDRLAAKIPHPRIQIWFTGGEPTLHPKFFTFCQEVRRRYPNRFFIGLNTNGSRLPKYYLHLIEVVSRIQFSAHFGFAKLDRLYTSIVETRAKAQRLRTEGKYLVPPDISVNVMMEPEFWNDVTQFCERLRAAQVPFFMKRIRTKGNQLSPERAYIPVYTSDQLAYMKVQR